MMIGGTSYLSFQRWCVQIEWGWYCAVSSALFVTLISMWDREQHLYAYTLVKNLNIVAVTVIRRLRRRTSTPEALRRSTRDLIRACVWVKAKEQFSIRWVNKIQTPTHRRGEAFTWSTCIYIATPVRSEVLIPKLGRLLRFQASVSPYEVWHYI